MADVSVITAQVERARTVQASAAAMINGFVEQLNTAIAAAVAANDDADLTALTDLSTSLSSSVDELAAAVTANTPAAPPA